MTGDIRNKVEFWISNLEANLAGMDERLDILGLTDAQKIRAAEARASTRGQLCMARAVLAELES